MTTVVERLDPESDTGRQVAAGLTEVLASVRRRIAEEKQRPKPAADLERAA